MTTELDKWTELRIAMMRPCELYDGDLDATLAPLLAACPALPDLVRGTMVAVRTCDVMSEDELIASLAAAEKHRD